MSERDEDVAGKGGEVVRLLAGRGGDGHDGGMSDLEKRVGAIETKIAVLDQKVDALAMGARETQSDVKTLIRTVNEVAGKVSQLPNTWTIASWFVSVTFLVSGLVFTIARSVR